MELSKHNPPLSRRSGQQVPATYAAVVVLFVAIAQNGVAVKEALRDDSALGETPDLSQKGNIAKKMRRYGTHAAASRAEV